jgi:hypothetical protein
MRENQLVARLFEESDFSFQAGASSTNIFFLVLECANDTITFDNTTYISIIYLDFFIDVFLIATVEIQLESLVIAFEL